MNYISSFSINSKGAITEVILVFDLSAGEFLHGDAKFSREFCMGMPNSLFGGRYQNHYMRGFQNPDPMYIYPPSS